MQPNFIIVYIYSMSIALLNIGWNEGVWEDVQNHHYRYPTSKTIETSPFLAPQATSKEVGASTTTFYTTEINEYCMKLI